MGWRKQEVFLRVEGNGEARTAGYRTTQYLAHNHDSTVMSETLFAQHRQIVSCAANLLGRRRKRDRVFFN